MFWYVVKPTNFFYPMSKKKVFAVSFVFGVLCMVLTSFENAFSIFAAALLSSSVIAGGTWILLDRLKDKEGMDCTYLIPSAVMSGYLLFPLVMFLSACISSSTYSGLTWGCDVICCGSVALMACCYKERRLSVCVLSLVIYLLMNLCVHPLWVYGVNHNFDHSFVASVRI